MTRGSVDDWSRLAGLWKVFELYVCFFCVHIQMLCFVWPKCVSISVRENILKKPFHVSPTVTVRTSASHVSPHFSVRVASSAKKAKNKKHKSDIDFLLIYNSSCS